MDKTKIKRIQCTKCKAEIKGSVPFFCVSFGDTLKTLIFCDEHRKKYTELVIDIQKTKEKLLGEFLYGNTV